MIRKLARKLTRRSSSKGSSKTDEKAKKISSISSNTTVSKSTLKRITMEELNALISARAFEFYCERGYSHGDDRTDWYRAEKLVTTSLKQ